MIWIVVILVGLFIVVNLTAYIVQSGRNFGRLPRGERLARVQQSPNYRDGAFQNLIHTPPLTEGVKPMDILTERLFTKVERLTPTDSIPTVKTDLKGLDPQENVLIWLGHSSYFIQLDGKRILIDPVLSGHASPFSFLIKAFKGSDLYKAEDMPEIDYLFMTHDHWDHLDYKTLVTLRERVSRVICTLGVGEHFERWGFEPERIVEMDWNESCSLQEWGRVHCLPTRHFSGRTQKRNTSLWGSYLLESPLMKIYIGGDGGYGPHFAAIGEQFGGVDLALLENGQYDRKWRYIHSQPEEVVAIAREIGAQRFIPGHSSKFALAQHPWDEPLRRVTEAFHAAQADTSQPYAPQILTPMIGEPVRLNDTTQTFTEWWVGVE